MVVLTKQHWFNFPAAAQQLSLLLLTGQSSDFFRREVKCVFGTQDFSDYDEYSEMLLWHTAAGGRHLI